MIGKFRVMAWRFWSRSYKATPPSAAAAAPTSFLAMGMGPP